LPPERRSPYAVQPSMQNLRDKLLQAGLVTAEQAAEAQVRPATAPARADRAGSDRRPRDAAGPLIAVRPQPLPASVPKLPPLPGSREAQRLESRKQLEQDRELRQRVTAAQVQLEPGDRAFYFVTRRNRLRRLEITTAQAAALESGALAVVERPDPGQIEHALVPAAAAEGLFRDCPRAVRFFNRSGEPVGFLSEDELRTRQSAEAEGAAAPDEMAMPGDASPDGRDLS
jgi:uncharacterized protein YaiL (DUF2058 family)